MPDSDSASGGLRSALARLWGHFGEAVVLRGRLASLELARERQRAFTLLGWFTAAAFFAMMTVFAVTLFVVALFWESHRTVVMAAFVAVYALIAILAFLRVNHMLRNLPPMLEKTFSVLENDYRCMTDNKDDTRPN